MTNDDFRSFIVGAFGMTLLLTSAYAILMALTHDMPAAIDGNINISAPTAGIAG